MAIDLRADLEHRGTDLGHPARARPSPHIGSFPMPARGIFAIGQAHWEIRDREEYEQTRHAVGVVGPV